MKTTSHFDTAKPSSHIKRQTFTQDVKLHTICSVQLGNRTSKSTTQLTDF